MEVLRVLALGSVKEEGDEPAVRRMTKTQQRGIKESAIASQVALVSTWTWKRLEMVDMEEVKIPIFRDLLVY